MWAMIKRAILPAFLLLFGITSLIYGVRFHATSVVEEQEVEETVRIPSPFEPPPFFPEPPPFFPEPPPFFPGPPPIFETVIKKVRVTKDESEPTLIREVTVGGVTLLASGELKRTYSGKAPSLCPT